MGYDLASPSMKSFNAEAAADKASGLVVPAEYVKVHLNLLSTCLSPPS